MISADLGRTLESFVAELVVSGRGGYQGHAARVRSPSSLFPVAQRGHS